MKKNTVKKIVAAKAKPAVKAAVTKLAETLPAGTTKDAIVETVEKANEVAASYIPPTEEGLERFPDLNDIAKLEAKKEEAPGVVNNANDTDMTDAEFKSALDFMQPYMEAYPGEKKFHVTSDYSVFLDANKADAHAHQKQLNPDFEVVVFEV
jgi:hypothetical protein